MSRSGRSRSCLTVVSVVTLCWISISTGRHKNDARSDELSEAASRGDAAKVQALLKADPGLISSRDSHGNTPLHFAVLHGHRDVAELLLANKADVDVKTSRGFTPLYLAASRGNKEMAELLLAHGANITALSTAGATPLHLAAKQNRQAISEFLHSRGGLNPPVNTREWPYP